MIGIARETTEQWATVGTRVVFKAIRSRSEKEQQKEGKNPAGKGGWETPI